MKERKIGKKQGYTDTLNLLSKQGVSDTKHFSKLRLLSIKKMLFRRKNRQHFSYRHLKVHANLETLHSSDR